MDKRIAGLLGAAAALATVSTAQAATPAQGTQLAPAATYAELLNPVPDAVNALKADDSRLSETPGVQLVGYRHHHHHHHHGMGRMLRHMMGRHHHHHHHRF